MLSHVFTNAVIVQVCIE